MTQEEKSQAIAEAIGIFSTDQWGCLYHTESGYKRDCPNYFSDLNACAEAEAKLPEDEYSLYGWTLLGDGKIECRDFLSASASQRAETLYKILCN